MKYGIWLILLPIFRDCKMPTVLNKQVCTASSLAYRLPGIGCLSWRIAYLCPVPPDKNVS